jgi:hypothetical protein
MASLLLTVTIADQVLDQLGHIPWWLWLAILLAIMMLLAAGFFIQEDSSHRYPGDQIPPPKADEQTSTGTELESDLSG